jgi:hypothetical protein
MTMSKEEPRSKSGLLDAIGRIFKKEESQPTAAKPDQPADSLHVAFESAVRQINEKVAAQQRAAAGKVGNLASFSDQAEDRAAERVRRQDAAHQAIRGDIEKMHDKLGTGIKAADLEPLARALDEVAQLAAPGRDSHEFVPRVRYAIAEKLQAEAGTLAADRLVALLQRANMSWPDPTRHRPGDSEEVIERSRRRRRAETREAFLSSDLKRTAERMLGIVKAWGSDYPDRGTPLWEETVLEAVAAGLRALLVRDFVEVLRADLNRLLKEAESSVGKEVAALQQVLSSGESSVERANQAVASSLKVLDQVVPQIAWDLVKAARPLARGEWA